ncbi:MAG TPA: dihydroxyacetone kinase subunit DhaL, partial [Actinocrinis sp.]|nr:dihydroxyacetone kinase subunit DhaL [Actinocrinis sp.]
GFAAALAALDGYQPTTVGDVLVKTGSTLISVVGGAAGPLYGTLFRAAGKQLAVPSADAGQLLAALTAGLEGVQKLGAAVPGDKTMVDALVPALAAFGEQVRSDADADLKSAAASAANAAEQGMRDTVALQARKGRASYLGARSIGHQDPGATSTALIFRALAQVVA